MTAFAEPIVAPQPAAAVRPPRHCVLVVDDDPTICEVLATRLEHQGFRTLKCGRGIEGLALARQERPSLVVLDIRLPDIDGLAVCEVLADDPETCAIPVIILSGQEDPDLVRRCRAAGCHYFLHKPYDPNALLTLIRHAIGEAGAWRGHDLCDGSWGG
jgi:twitching motility two-component system response regulator PilH